MELQAERIDIDWTTATMSAVGAPDSSDTTGAKERGSPIMKDGGEEYHGRELGYNFRTKKGRINIADTRIDQGYYHGEKIKKEEKEKFDKLRDHLLRLDDEVTCKTCGKKFEIPSLHSMMRSSVPASRLANSSRWWARTAIRRRRPGSCPASRAARSPGRWS